MAKKRSLKRKLEITTRSDKVSENHQEQLENGEANAKNIKRKKLSIKNEIQNNTSTSVSKIKNKSKGKDEDVIDYEVEKIIDVNYKSNNKRVFRIRWKNYSSKHDTWEPEENLSCDELISKFLETQGKRAKTPRKELREKPKMTSRFVSPGGRKSKRNVGNKKNYIEDEDGHDSF
ncbi:hypothetical protein PGB90_007347 [Kerria lacca]